MHTYDNLTTFFMIIFYWCSVILLIMFCFVFLTGILLGYYNIYIFLFIYIQIPHQHLLHWSMPYSSRTVK